MRRKADIEYHGLGYGSKRVPAVNVKVRDWDWQRAFLKWVKWYRDYDPRFTVEWIEEHVSDEQKDQIFWRSCEQGWEDLQEKAEEIYGSHVKVYSEGRSGGWAYIDGMNTDVDSWDAIEFTQWRSFSNYAKRRAKSILADCVDSIYINEFDLWADEQVEIRDEQSELAAPEIPEAFVGIA